MAKNKNNAAKIVIAVLIVVLAGIGAYFGYTFVSNDINGNEEYKTEYNLYISDGDTQYDVSQRLYSNGIVANDSLWSNWMDRHYPDYEYCAGEFLLTNDMSYEEIAQKLQNPDVSHKSVSVCIPEGYNVFDIATALEENGICSGNDFLEACRSKDDYDYSFISEIPESDTIAYELEGFLFPATYDFEENMDAGEVVDEMLAAFADRVTDSWRSYCSENDITLYELVTLASVVEKETLGEGVAQNIASVFINRLNSSHKLQSDVTIDYGNALRANGFDDSVVTSYNTYKCSALPSGPICNPGVANIDAVVNHTDTDYFYFFSYNNGADFYFTDDYSDFSKNWEKLKDTNTY
ncbi:MAG TPA: endolytic transglycosylase MltG [Candidatus Eubacterium faecigallinarum]|nr:endolytic transglycosylase MltG [Candidatus Eubacterium faecigallinarum]